MKNVIRARSESNNTKIIRLIFMVIRIFIFTIIRRKHELKLLNITF